VLTSDLVLAGSEMFKIHPDVIYADNRTAFVCRARFGLYMALYLRGASKTQVGRIMRRDHSTVIHGLIRADRMMKKDDSFKRVVDKLVNMHVDLGHREKEQAND